MSESLTQLLKEHQLEQKKRREEVEQKKKVAVRAIDQATGELVDTVNQGVARIFLTQRRIEEESAQLQKQTKAFCKESQEWATVLDKFNNAMKGLGDVSLWTESLENELTEIHRALQFVHTDLSANKKDET